MSILSRVTFIFNTPQSFSKKCSPLRANFKTTVTFSSFNNKSLSPDYLKISRIILLNISFLTLLTSLTSSKIDHNHSSWCSFLSVKSSISMRMKRSMVKEWFPTMFILLSVAKSSSIMSHLISTRSVSSSLRAAISALLILLNRGRGLNKSLLILMFNF